MRIFLAYGKNKELKDRVHNFLARSGHSVIDLAEECNKGKTIIEKLESYSNVDKAVILLTSDDNIKPYRSRKMFKCARQNVIFELGYFIAKLSRENVIVIIDNKNVLKLLTDYQTSYIKNDKNMEKDLEKELRN